jgi:hypothetical protein
MLAEALLKRAWPFHVFESLMSGRGRGQPPRADFKNLAGRPVIPRLPTASWGNAGHKLDVIDLDYGIEGEDRLGLAMAPAAMAAMHNAAWASCDGAPCGRCSRLMGLVAGHDTNLPVKLPA